MQMLKKNKGVLCVMVLKVWSSGQWQHHLGTY